jgi:hypothetical protein
MLDPGSLVRTFSPKTMARRFGHDFHGLTICRRTGHFSRKKCNAGFHLLLSSVRFRSRWLLVCPKMRPNFQSLGLICPNIRAIYQLVKVERIRVREPFWVWPTRLGMRKVGLPYTYRDLEQSGLDDLKHLYAINEIRLHLVDDDEGTQWVSERQLLQGVVRSSGQELLHRPDGEIYWSDGAITGVEAELSLKKPFELAENFMELLRGKEYLRAKADFGWKTARSMSRGDQSQYADIWYFAPPSVRRLLRRERARLVSRGDLSEKEAERLFVRWYPLATDEEAEQEEAEDDEVLAIDSENDDQNADDEGRPEPEGEQEER